MYKTETATGLKGGQTVSGKRESKRPTITITDVNTTPLVLFQKSKGPRFLMTGVRVAVGEDFPGSCCRYPRANAEKGNTSSKRSQGRTSFVSRLTDTVPSKAYLARRLKFRNPREIQTYISFPFTDGTRTHDLRTHRMLMCGQKFHPSLPLFQLLVCFESEPQEGPWLSDDV